VFKVSSGEYSPTHNISQVSNGKRKTLEIKRRNLFGGELFSLASLQGGLRF
jgi:hypothetical protein